MTRHAPWLVSRIPDCRLAYSEIHSKINLFKHKTRADLPSGGCLCSFSLSSSLEDPGTGSLSVLDLDATALCFCGENDIFERGGAGGVVGVGAEGDRCGLAPVAAGSCIAFPLLFLLPLPLGTLELGLVEPLVCASDICLVTFGTWLGLCVREAAESALVRTLSRSLDGGVTVGFDELAPLVLGVVLAVEVDVVFEADVVLLLCAAEADEVDDEVAMADVDDLGFGLCILVDVVGEVDNDVVVEGEDPPRVEAIQDRIEDGISSSSSQKTHKFFLPQLHRSLSRQRYGKDVGGRRERKKEKEPAGRRTLYKN
jgi:hypothetical protein